MSSKTIKSGKRKYLNQSYCVYTFIEISSLHASVLDSIDSLSTCIRTITVLPYPYILTRVFICTIGTIVSGGDSFGPDQQTTRTTFHFMQYCTGNKTNKRLTLQPNTDSTRLASRKLYQVFPMIR